ncbi:alpha/beta hydrolase [Candidatus Cyanaurora vandensis]|uniref:alpha/beta hydrolase n=1 Tax=Candidatus Cyanaurora vandensis TaxID=2714958 RepID=UPI00257AF6EF|nr:alpha/beta hydrolase [Candidatus Cyanaurora vandensis]
MSPQLTRRDFVMFGLTAAALHQGAKAATATPDSQMSAVLNELATFGSPPLEKLSPLNARNSPTPANAVQSLLSKQSKPIVEPVAKVSHILIPGPMGDLLARVYQPQGTGPFPVLVYFHGGGWVIATLDTYDSSCRALTNAAGCVVVSVAYRQAPEAKFPAAPEDAYAAIQWVMNNTGRVGGDPQRVAVGGESAGGNLAAVTCLMARDRGGKMPVHQLLVYPVTNYAFDTPSYQESAQAKPLNAAMMRWFWGYYLANEAEGRNPYASPLRATNFRGLPNATLITAQIDPLRSEGQAYGQKLREVGLTVKAVNYEGVAHEFFGMGAVVDKARAAVTEAAAGLRTGFRA